VNETTLRAQYQEQKPYLGAWGNLVTSTVLKILSEILPKSRPIDEFLKIPPKPRVKGTDSFISKVLTRKKYSNPLEDTTDRVGVRFVVLLYSDIQIVESAITSCPFWTAQKDRDFQNEKLERPHHFDYQSVHFIVRNKTVERADEIAIPPGTPCEVQVRTLMQHAWAEMTHDTVYKPQIATSDGVSRQVAKSAALVETTDEIFLAVQREIDQACAAIRGFREVASVVYASTIGIAPGGSEKLGFAILEPYADLLSTEKNTLESFLEEMDFIADKVRERESLSLLYREPSILWVYWLVFNEPFETPRRWKLDQSHLEAVYSDLGISMGEL
jgi:putative GTP pyrophosphokinase